MLTSMDASGSSHRIELGNLPLGGRDCHVTIERLLVQTPVTEPDEHRCPDCSSTAAAMYRAGDLGLRTREGPEWTARAERTDHSIHDLYPYGREGLHGHFRLLPVAMITGIIHCCRDELLSLAV